MLNLTWPCAPEKQCWWGQAQALFHSWERLTAKNYSSPSDSDKTCGWPDVHLNKARCRASRYAFFTPQKISWPICPHWSIRKRPLTWPDQTSGKFSLSSHPWMWPTSNLGQHTTPKVPSASGASLGVNLIWSTVPSGRFHHSSHFPHLAGLMPSPHKSRAFAVWLISWGADLLPITRPPPCSCNNTFK